MCVEWVMVSVDWFELIFCVVCCYVDVWCWRYCDGMIDVW